MLCFMEKVTAAPLPWKSRKWLPKKKNESGLLSSLAGMSSQTGHYQDYAF